MKPADIGLNARAQRRKDAKTTTPYPSILPIRVLPLSLSPCLPASLPPYPSILPIRVLPLSLSPCLLVSLSAWASRDRTPTCGGGFGLRASLPRQWAPHSRMPARRKRAGRQRCGGTGKWELGKPERLCRVHPPQRTPLFSSAPVRFSLSVPWAMRDFASHRNGRRRAAHG